MNSMKETAVEMGNIIKKMSEHVPKSFLWHHILLPAMLAITALYHRAAVQAVLFCSLGNMRHRNFSLKISTKKYKNPFFFVTEQLR